MSDEDSLGTTGCCLPRRIFVMILAIGFLLYGVYNAFYFIIFAYIEMFKLTPSSHCSGPGCHDNLTCEATREASYHLRVCVMSIGSLFFGIIGINAIYNKYSTDLFYFAVWILVVAVVYAFCGFADGAYMVICGNQYSYNVMTEAILWPIRNLPLHNGIKYEVRQLNTYPVEYVNALCFHNVGIWYALWTILRVVFWVFAAYDAFVLAQRFHYGLAGMGATFSIEGWKKRLKMRDAVDEVAYNTFDMAWATGMDLGWTEDEFKLQRPMRNQSRYFGAMPQAAANAYDGFNDDRRNVLL